MQNSFIVAFPRRLKELRASRTQASISGELGINQQTYARWELGDRQPKLQDLCAIALHFGVSSDWLLGLEERGPPSIRAHNSAVAVNGHAVNGHAPAAPCPECVKKDEAIARLERVIDKLTK